MASEILLITLNSDLLITCKCESVMSRFKAITRDTERKSGQVNNAIHCTNITQSIYEVIISPDRAVKHNN